MVGASEMEDVTVNVVEALLELPSVAETVLAPAGEDCIVNVAPNVPVAEVVMVNGDVDCAVPS
jgi:hypothetical protein